MSFGKLEPPNQLFPNITGSKGDIVDAMFMIHENLKEKGVIY